MGRMPAGCPNDGAGLEGPSFVSDLFSFAGPPAGSLSMQPAPRHRPPQTRRRHKKRRLGPARSPRSGAPTARTARARPLGPRLSQAGTRLIEVFLKGLAFEWQIITECVAFRAQIIVLLQVQVLVSCHSVLLNTSSLYMWAKGQHSKNPALGCAVSSVTRAV